MLPEPPDVPRRVTANSSNVMRGAFFSPAIWATLMARASRAYPVGLRAITTRCLPSGSGSTVRPCFEAAPSVSSAPNTVGMPTTRAASANRTTP